MLGSLKDADMDIHDTVCTKISIIYYLSSNLYLLFEGRQHPALRMSVCVCLSVSRNSPGASASLRDFGVLVVQANIVTGECQDSLTPSKSHLAYQVCQLGVLAANNLPKFCVSFHESKDLL